MSHGFCDQVNSPGKVVQIVARRIYQPGNLGNNLHCRQEGGNRQHDEWQTVGGRRQPHNQDQWTGHHYEQEREYYHTPTYNKLGPLQSPGNGGWE